MLPVGRGLMRMAWKRMGWPAATELRLDLLDDEVEGDLAGLAVFDDEAGAVDVDFVDEDFDFAAWVLSSPGFWALVDLRHIGALRIWAADGC